MIHIELKNDKLFKFIDNLEKRSHEKPIWAASKRLLHNTFLFRKDEETIANDQHLPSRWIKDTNEWSVYFAKALRIKVREYDLIEKLFPNQIGDFSQLVKDVIEKVPSASEPDEYITLYRKKAHEFNSEDRLVEEFARRLFDLCRATTGISDEKETYVDDLMNFLLVIADFGRFPLSFRQKPKFTLSYPRSNRTLVSQPDYAIFRTTSAKMSFFAPEIVAVGMENKILHGETGLGQAIGSSLVASLSNLSTHEKIQPVAMLRGRGYFLSFMKANFSMEFLDTIVTGENKGVESEVEIFPKRQLKSAHLGYNLLKAEERKLAFEALYRLRAFVLNLEE